MEEQGGNAFRVAIVDDDPGVRLALKLIVQSTDGFALQGSYDSGETVLAELDSKQPVLPDILLLDLRMPRMAGLTCAKLLQARFPALKIVIVTASRLEEDFRSALSLGLHGYLVKPFTLAEVRGALNCAASGLFVRTHDLGTIELHSTGLTGEPAKAIRLESLSAREWQVLRLLAGNHTKGSIAFKLKLRPSSVDTYLRRLYAKLNVHRRQDAIAVALRSGVDR